MDVQYNDHIYSYSALWPVLQAEGIISDQYATVEIWIGESPYKIVKAKEAEQIMQQIVVEQSEEFDQLTSEDVYLGDYYADILVYDQKTYIFVFCKTFLHNIAKKKYTPLRLKFFSDYFGLDRAFLSRKLSPVKLKMCA